MFPIRDTIPTVRTPYMTRAIIALNVLVFLFELGLSERQLNLLFNLFGLVPARFTHPDWALVAGFPLDTYWPFLTSMFLHGGWMHILANMWSLWIFGDNVEDRMGPLRYLAFYLVCGLAAALLHWATNLGSTVPTVGASGAVAGIMGAYFLLYPQAKVLTLIPILFYPLMVEIPAVVYLGLWFYMQFSSGILSVAGPEQVGGVAWWAHIGGFVAGAILLRGFLKYRDERQRPVRAVITRKWR